MHIYYFWNILRVFYSISMTSSPRIPNPRAVSTAPHVSFAQIEQLHQLVGDWFIANARDLPWRRADCSAWGVMVSEFMLQQTPVKRVLPVNGCAAGRPPKT